MLLNQTVAPSAKIVALSDAQRQTRLQPGDDDFVLSALVDLAGASVESMTGRAVRLQTWALAMNGASGKVMLPKVPVVSISAIDYFDSDDAAQSATIADFHLYKDDQRAWLEPKSGKDWPVTSDREDALTITFVAGYSTIPVELQHAALMCIAYWYDQRATAGESSTEVPFGATCLIEPFKVGWVAA